MSNPPPPGPAAPAIPSVSAWGLALLGAAAVFLAGLVVAPALPALHPLLAYGVAFAVVAGQTVLVSELLPRPERPLMLLLLPALAVLATVYFTRASWPPAAGAVSVALLCAGSLVGGLVGTRIEHAGHLLFVALISAGVDSLSVLHPQGVSAQVIQSEAALSVLAMSFPMLGSDIVAPLLGVGDIAFAALYLGAARAHGLSVARTRWALIAGFVLTAIVVVLTQLPVPALVLLGPAVVAVHPAARRPRPADLRAGLAGVGLLCVAGLVLYLRR